MATIDSTKKIIYADGGNKIFHITRVGFGSIEVCSSPTGNDGDWATIEIMNIDDCSYNVEVSVNRPSTWKIKIISSSEITSVEEMTISSGGGSEEEIQELQNETNELQGGDGSVTSETPEIDNVNNLKDFTEGYTQDQKLSDIVAGTVDEDSEELIMS